MASKEICATCLHGEAPADALARFAKQPSLEVSLQSGEITYDIRRSIDPEVRADMIADPKPAVEALDAYLSENPCQFVKTGRCAVADFAVLQLFNTQQV